MVSCSHWLELELSDFLAEPRAEAFAAFRAHYPGCPECSAELRVWTELHERLLADHPPPETLARYESLPQAARGPVDRHLERCPACREELSQLASFDPARLRSPAAPEPAGEEGGSWLAGLGRLLWNPAFAYALALLLVVPVLYRSLPRGERASPASLDRELFAEEAPQELRVARRSADALVEPGKAGPMLDRAEAVEGQAAPAEAERDVPAAADRVAAAPTPGAVREEAFREESKLAPEPAAAAATLAKRRAAAPASEAAGLALAAPGPQELRLRSGPPVPVTLAPGADLRLHFPVPPDAPAGAGAELSVTSESGRRALREPAEVPARRDDAERTLALTLPGGWLVPGRYRAVLRLEGRPEPLRYAFEVQAPAS